MYFEKFYEGAAITGIQDPDNVGNDLEEIEDAVEDSHDDEVDDALCGLPGEDTDPFEESAEIIYEAEYNFNMICKSIGLAELNEAARGSLNENKFTDVIKGGKDKAAEIMKAFIRWLSNMKAKIMAFFNKFSKDMFNDDFKTVYKDNKSIIDTYISNNTLDENIKIINFDYWRNAYNDIGDTRVEFDTFVNAITKETNTLNANDLANMINENNMTKSIKDIYSKVIKNINNTIAECKKKDNSEDINNYKNKIILTTKKFNYLISLIKTTQLAYKSAARDAIKDGKKSNKKDSVDSDETPKTESAFDIRFI